MSFSSDVKKEICSVEQFDRESLKAELYGIRSHEKLSS